MSWQRVTIPCFFCTILFFGLMSIFGAILTFRYTPQQRVKRVQSHNSVPIRTDPKFPLNGTRKEQVINSIQHAWRGYSYYALDADELLPISRLGSNNWGKLQWTLIDSLDTLILAELKEELNEARHHLDQSSFSQNVVVGTSPTTVHLLGGLLGAYELSKDPMYLEKAIDIGNRIMRAFGSSSGFPTKQVHMMFGHPNWLSIFKTRKTSLVSAGTLQLELSHLSYITKDPKYRKKGYGALIALRTAHQRMLEDEEKYEDPHLGLYAMNYNVDTGNVTSMGLYTMGLGAESFYEYLLKLFILEGGQDDSLIKDYVLAMDDMTKHLVKNFTLNNGEAGFVLINTIGSFESKEMEHLTCFVPGMLVLGAMYGKMHDIPLLKERFLQHMLIGKGLMKTCGELYFSQPTGLSADTYEWDDYKLSSLRVQDENQFYALRPETVESLFVLFRVTGDLIYQEMGWKIFQAIEKACRTPVAYATLKDVRVKKGKELEHEDKMESFLLGSTLKYLFLLFGDPKLLPLDEFVFTTAGHAFPIHKIKK